MKQPEPRLHRLAALLVAAPLALTACVSSESPPPPGFYTEGAALADLDGDGLLDVLSVSSVFAETWLPGYLTARIQDGGASFHFAEPIRTATCLDPEAIALGDVDGDGRLDVAVACGASATNVYEVDVHLQLTTRPGSFGAPLPLSTGWARPTSVRLADLDGDGHPDLLIGVADGTQVLLYFLVPGPDGHFASARSFGLEVGAAPVAVTAADLTGVGRLDLVVTTSDGRVVVLLHDTAPGTFKPGVSYPAGLYPVAVEVADLDGDGHPDLLMVDRSGALLVMTQRAGGGAFDPVVAHDLFDENSRALVVSDLDGDGRLDVAVASAGPPGLPGSVAIFYQAPAAAPPGTLLSPQRYTGYSGPLSVVAGDVDGDGLVDLVIADGLASIRFRELDGRYLPPLWLRQ
jgi:hypothetical protein